MWHKNLLTLHVMAIFLMICLMACNQNREGNQKEGKVHEGLKQRIGKWTMIKNDASESFVPFLLASRGIINANSEQGVLFVRQRDEDGQLLKAGKRYAIKGDSIKAESWSLTVYHDDKLTAKRGQHYISSYEIEATTDNNWKVLLSPTKNQNSPSLVNRDNENGSPKVTFRIYNPSPSFLENLGKSELPSIQSIEQ